MLPRGLEPRTLRVLAVRSNQLSYESHLPSAHGGAHTLVRVRRMHPYGARSSACGVACLGLPGVIWGCLGLPGVAWGCLVLPGVAWGCRGLPGGVGRGRGEAGSWLCVAAGCSAVCVCRLCRGFCRFCRRLADWCAISVRVHDARNARHYSIPCIRPGDLVV